MHYEHLIKWGRTAFEKGLSLAHIENYLLKRGFRKTDVLNALHQITDFQHKINLEDLRIRKSVVIILVSALLIISMMIFLYFAGALK